MRSALRTPLVGIACAWLLASPAATQDDELARDSGDKAGHRSSAGTGHVVAFDAPPKNRRWLHTVRIHGARYGGGYDPAKTPFVVSICDAKLKELGRTESTYASFRSGKFGWVDVRLDEPLQLTAPFSIVVSFDPERTRGVFVGYSEAAGDSHSATGLPGRAAKSVDHEWMIRAVVAKKKPKPTKAAKASAAARKKEAKKRAAVYARDFDALAKTIARQYPAFDKKGIDWRAVSRAARAEFRSATDDAEHLRNVYRLIARLRDTHSSVREAKVDVHVPSFDGLYGAGLWIAVDRGRLIVRDWLPGHALADDLVRGAELVSVGGRPARLVRDDVHAQVRAWHGFSSDHFLDARLSTQWFPFGEARTLSCEVLKPDGTVAALELPRWGPGGRGLSRVAATLPDGCSSDGPATSVKLDDGRLGYVRILGKMDEATRDAFSAAVDALQGVDGIVLDCRGMGGGGDSPAWAMAGRFFTERTANGTARPLEPTGAWQFDGPVVMLQDEREVSSAETFTWAMTETGRVVSVGRPTGGATIIPRVFELPSGLAKYRIGVRDRKTPIDAVQPEGIGTPPDVFVGYEPVLLAEHADPIFAVGAAVLRAIVAGGDREAITGAFAGLLGADVDRLEAAGAGGRAALMNWLSPDFVSRAIDHDVLLCTHDANPLPDYVGASERLARWAAVATWFGDDATAERATTAVQGWTAEADAQRAWAELEARAMPVPKRAAAKFAKDHAGTRWAANAAR